MNDQTSTRAGSADPQGFLGKRGERELDVYRSWHADWRLGEKDNGWSYVLSVSTRQGGNDDVRGVYYNAFGYFAAIEKCSTTAIALALSVLGAPTERGAQQASYARSV